MKESNVFNIRKKQIDWCSNKAAVNARSSWAVMQSSVSMQQNIRRHLALLRYRLIWWHYVAVAAACAISDCCCQDAARKPVDELVLLLYGQILAAASIYLMVLPLSAFWVGQIHLNTLLHVARRRYHIQWNWHGTRPESSAVRVPTQLQPINYNEVRSAITGPWWIILGREDSSMGDKPGLR